MQQKPFTNPGGLSCQSNLYSLFSSQITNSLLTEQAGRCESRAVRFEGIYDQVLTDWPISKDAVRIMKLSSVCIWMIVASIFKAFCHWKHSWCCQTVYRTGWAASSCNWMSIRPKQFWLIHSTSLSIFTRTDYIWQIVTFSWTPWLEAWACSWQRA